MRGGEDVEVTLGIDGERRVVVRVLGALLQEADGAGHGAGGVIVVGNEVLQLILPLGDISG